MNEDLLPPHMRPERSFQGLILALQRYWADFGCIILQPYDMEVGAGTFHPATTLRALGPKSWNAAYVQPSRRPKDGRYGENPNRLQHYYQLQVILKPSPDDLQELYLKSLYAIGIDPKVHDIRSVVWHARDNCNLQRRCQFQWQHFSNLVPDRKGEHYDEPNFECESVDVCAAYLHRYCGARCTRGRCANWERRLL